MLHKQDIIEVAYEEFITKGYTATSLSDISDKLDITKPALYYHFSSKKQLYLRVVEYYNSKLLEQSLRFETDPNSTKQTLKNLLLNYIELTFPKDGKMKRNHYYFTIDAIHQFPELKESIVASASSVVETIHSILLEGVKKGHINKEIDLQALMFHVGVMLEGLSAISFLVDQIDENIFQRYFELFWSSIVR